MARSTCSLGQSIREKEQGMKLEELQKHAALCNDCGIRVVYLEPEEFVDTMHDMRMKMGPSTPDKSQVPIGNVEFRLNGVTYKKVLDD